MAWLKRKVQGHLDSFRGERKSSSTDKVNVDVKIQGPDDGLHLSDLESSISSSQGDFRTLIKQQKQQEEAEEARKSKGSKLKVKGHRRGRSDGSIFIKQREERGGERQAIFDTSNNLLRQMSTSSGSLEYKGSYGHIQTAPIQREFTNLSFLTEDDNDGSIQQALEKWQAHSGSLDANYISVKKVIDERQQLLVSMVTQHAQELLAKLERKYQEQKTQAETCIGDLERCKKGSQSVLDDFNEPTDPSSVLASLPSIPSGLSQLTHQTEDSLGEAVLHLFGHFQTIKARASVSPEEVSVSSETDPPSPSHRLMTRPQYLGSIATKTSKDTRECGLTDIAMTKDRNVIVVDKHNKLVKLFDTDGKLVRYIGRNILKDPSRVSVLPWSEQILITDSGCQELKLFTLDGAMVNTVAPDLSAPSGHCVIPDTRQIAVINFDTKLVTVYEEDSDGVFRKLRSFPTGLDCPAYIACTASKHLVISDWSAHKLRIYNQQGTFIKQISKTGAGQGQISKPQGVHGDCHGNVFLGEKGNRRLQIFNENGDSTFLMDKKTYDIHLPMALDTTEDGNMAVAEYQGKVKFYKYLDLPQAKQFVVGQRQSKGRGMSVVSPEVVVTNSESVM